MESQQQFNKLTFGMKRKLVTYFQQGAPAMVERRTLRFIDDNFRKQGWQGASFEPWKENKRRNTILVRRGHLRRSINSERAGLGSVRFYTNVKYAAVHNRGEKVNIPARQSTIRHRLDKDGNLMNQAQIGVGPHRKSKSNLLVFGKKSHKRVRETTVDIKGYSFTMPRRQFAPYQGSESPVLNKSIIVDLEKDLTKLLNS